jgi:hypothetical protein
MRVFGFLQLIFESQKPELIFGNNQYFLRNKNQICFFFGFFFPIGSRIQNKKKNRFLFLVFDAPIGPTSRAIK